MISTISNSLADRVLHLPRDYRVTRNLGSRSRQRGDNKVVRPHLFQKILCPIDLRDDSFSALDLACQVAKQNRANLLHLNVVDIPPYSTEMRPEALKPYPVWEHDAKLRLDQIAAEHVQMSYALKLSRGVDCQLQR